MEYKFVNELKYTSSHEWIKIDENLATIGITDFAQRQLGDIVYVELPNVGDFFEKEKDMGEIESVKAVGEIVMPLTGEIVEINEELAKHPELLNESPYENGWLIKIKISNSSEIDELLSVGDYQELVKKEE
jgi:glycine cleavage system H protein